MDNNFLLNVVLKTSEHRGDHAASIMVAVKANPDMTIRELVELCFKTGFPDKAGGFRVGNDLIDHIEIRIAY